MAPSIQSIVAAVKWTPLVNFSVLENSKFFQILRVRGKKKEQDSSRRMAHTNSSETMTNGGGGGGEQEVSSAPTSNLHLVNGPNNTTTTTTTATTPHNASPARTNNSNNTTNRASSSTALDYTSIAKLYTDRSVFITGGTGFMGKVLVEKLLRSCPGIKNIYLLIRPKRGQETAARLNDLLNTPVSEYNGALQQLVMIIVRA